MTIETTPARTIAVVATSAQSYATDIAAEWQPVLDAAPDLVAAILATGRRLLDVKADLPHGSWLQLFRHGAACKAGCSHVKQPVPFGVNTAQRIMRIAKNPAISNAAHAQHLPGDWTTLAGLTRLPPPILERALADGTVHPTMRREDVRALKPARAQCAAAAHKQTPGEILKRLKLALTLARGDWPRGGTLRPMIELLRFEVSELEKREARRGS